MRTSLKIAVYQAPLLPLGCMDAIELIRQKIQICEAESVNFLCCPEGILGGLADYDENPLRFALRPADLDKTLAPLTSRTVTTIVGFTERGEANEIFNSAAIFHQGKTVGVYRKVYPAIRTSVYTAGKELPVFQIGDLTFGIIICNDSNYVEPARVMALKGATVIFVPTNNGLPANIDGRKLSIQAGDIDITRAVGNNVWIARADVVGEIEGLQCYGSSGITDFGGNRVAAPQGPTEELLIADIKLQTEIPLKF